MITLPQAFIFDLNGTMINDMKFHEDAWFDILNNRLGKKISSSVVKRQMYGKNTELLERVFGEDYFSPEEAEKISFEKEEMYQRNYLPHLKLIDGLHELLEFAKANGIQMAIGSAAIPLNIDFVLDNLNIRHYFKQIISADDVSKSKPDPETFTKAAKLLGVSAEASLVFEDVPKGVEAALNAGMKSIVLTTTHTQEDFSSYNNILSFIKDFNDPFIKNIIKN
jgi:beta-phosphoglucomutase